MKRSFRILPLTMLLAFLLLGLKIGEVLRDGHTVLLSLTSEARAEQAAEPKKEDETPTVKPAEKPAEKATDKPLDKPVEKPADKAVDKAADKAEAHTEKAGSADTESLKEGESKKDSTKNKHGDGDSPTESQEEKKHEYSQIEIDLLQSLAKRREALDEWGRQMQLRENMLIATEQRINDKIDTLQKMKKELEGLLALYNEQEDLKIRSLVKIYENMKPKDAARIFEELDMPVLLMVVDKMSERKVAPILAGMSPTKAKDLTIQLAEQRKLQKNRPNTSTTAPETSATK